MVTAAALVAIASALPAAVPSDAIVLPGKCAENSRIGEGNVFQDQWMLSHQLARPFRCSRVVIEPKPGGLAWIIFDSGASTKRADKPVMIFIGGASAPTKEEIDVIGGQAYYGNLNGDTYAWPGQITCAIHFRPGGSERSAYKVVCTAIVNRGSDERILAAVLNR